MTLTGNTLLVCNNFHLRKCWSQERICVLWTSAEFFALEFLALYFLTHGNFTILSFLLQRYLAYLMTCFVTDFHLLLALLNILTATFIWWLLCTRQSKQLFLTHHNICDFRDSYHVVLPFPSCARLNRSSPLLTMKLSLQLISSILLLSKFSLIPLEKASRFVRNDFTNHAHLSLILHILQHFCC